MAPSCAVGRNILKISEEVGSVKVSLLKWWCLVFLSLLISTVRVYGACSAYKNAVIINEVNTQDKDKNVELYVLPNTVSSSSTFSVTACSKSNLNNPPSCETGNVTFNGNLNYLVLTLNTTANNKDYIDIVVKLGSDVVDYLNLYNAGSPVVMQQTDASQCGFNNMNSYPDRYIKRSNSGQREFYRSPDGSSVWIEDQPNQNVTFGGTNFGSPLSILADYHFDECYWDGTTGEVRDNSSNGYHGTAKNGLLNEPFGKIYRGGNFDGVDDYVELNNFPNLNKDFTITAWINAGDVGFAKRIFIDDKNNSSGYGFSLGDGGNGRLRFFTRGVNPVILDSPANTIDAGQWYFVTAVHDSSTKTKSIYVNGNLVANGSYTGNWSFDNGPASIGGEVDGAVSGEKYRFDGKIDEVMVFDSALSATQLLGIYNNQRISKNFDGSGRPAVICASAEYRFDGCSETETVIDSSGYGFNGIIQNGPIKITSGKVCNAGYFDGINDFVEVNDSDKFDNTSELTIMGWINPKDIKIPPQGTNARGIVSKRNHYSGNSQYSFGVFFYSSQHDGKIYVDLDTQNNRFSSNTVIAEDVWTHFAVVFNGTLSQNQRTKLYINGVLDKTAPETSTTIPDYNSNLYIGNLFTGSELKVYKGFMDEINIIPKALTKEQIQQFVNATRPDCNLCEVLDHYTITHDGVGLTCQPENIKITACGDNNTPCTEYTLNTDVTLNYDSNSQNYSFIGSTFADVIHQTPGTVTLSLNNMNPVATNGYRCFNAVVGSNSCDIVFYDSGFVFDILDNYSCKPQNVAIKAVRKDDETQKCIPSFQNVTLPIDFSFNYVTPSSGTIKPQVNNQELNKTIDLIFDANGESSFSFVYPDAGRVGITASFDNGTVKSVGSDEAVLKPFGFYVYTSDSNFEAESGADSTVFKKAGETFNLSAKAVCWESDTDTELSNNALTPNYQKNDVDITHLLTAPVGGDQGNISEHKFNFINGDASIDNQSYSEVGIITFTVNDGDYLGAGDITGTSKNIGRFIPFSFLIDNISNGTLENQNVTFNYMGQTTTYNSSLIPSFTVKAVNVDNITVTNYRDDFLKLESNEIILNYPSNDNITKGADGNYLPVNFSPSTITLTKGFGVGGVVFGYDNVTYLRNINTLTKPFTPNLNINVENVNDGELSVSFIDKIINVTGSSMYFGRLNIENAYGSELDNLSVPIFTEYFDGNIWKIVSDNTTTLNLSDFGLDNYSGNLNSGETSLNFVSGISNGLGNITLSAPGEGNDGTVDLYLKVGAPFYSWLVDIFDNKSRATETFGIYRGNDRIIDWMEVPAR